MFDNILRRKNDQYTSGCLPQRTMIDTLALIHQGAHLPPLNIDGLNWELFEIQGISQRLKLSDDIFRKITDFAINVLRGNPGINLLNISDDGNDIRMLRSLSAIEPNKRAYKLVHCALYDSLKKLTDLGQIHFKRTFAFGSESSLSASLALHLQYMHAQCRVMPSLDYRIEGLVSGYLVFTSVMDKRCLSGKVFAIPISNEDVFSNICSKSLGNLAASTDVSHPLVMRFDSYDQSHSSPFLFDIF